jgi:hypothetical protein
MVRRRRRKSQPEDEFDDSFIVDGEETFFFGNEEVVVENALHVVKDSQEYVFIDKQIFPIESIDDNQYNAEKHSPQQNNEQPKQSLDISRIFSWLIICGIAAQILIHGAPLVIGYLNENRDSQIDLPTSDTISSVTKTSTTVPQSVEYIKRNYQWIYENVRYTYSLSIPEPLYEYFKTQPHDRNYQKYAISEKDRKALGSIVSTFEEKTSANSAHDSAYNIIAFVQSLPYFTDKISTGYDDYPRYPIETLVNNGGDCEDTAILTAALLKEMNYDVVLLLYPKHMAIGVTCNGCRGTSYTYNNKKYYYLETTSGGWKVGQVPSGIQGQAAKIYPI